MNKPLGKLSRSQLFKGLFLGIIMISAAGVIYLQFNKSEKLAENQQTSDSNVPSFLLSSFPDTDWSKTNVQIEKALDGGPGKDGIPAIDNPKFTSLSEFNHSDEIQVIAVPDGGDRVKLYPYNILVWHEIVNDTADGKPIAVTFCPLCGSAIVFDRTLADGTKSTFGVSGALIESNMIMYDRHSETLWQQSTGKALAGKHLRDTLNLVQFQLLTIGEAKEQYSNAVVLSEDTGQPRDYARNPYSGYENNNDFIFSPSSKDDRYPSKAIFVAFKVNNKPVAAPWLEIKNGETYETEVDGQTITLDKTDRELQVTDANGDEIPFYFEMWFSWAVQHEANGIVFDPTK